VRNRALAVQQARDEALHLRPRAQNIDAHAKPVDRHRQQEVDGDARHHEAWGLRLDGARQER